MMTDEGDIRTTVHILTKAVNDLEEELNCLNTKSGIFRHLARSYLNN